MKYNFESLYEHIGYLFYGLVSRNGKISATDLLKLTELVDNTWKPGPTGDQTLSVHLADVIHRGIRYASTNMMTTPRSIDSFKSYFTIHSLAFSSALRERILISVDTIIKEFPRNIDAGPIEGDLRQLFSAPRIPA
jgi:hypothetical protein